MGALVPFENTKVGKKVAPLLSEQSETEPYQIDGIVVRAALAKNTDALAPIWIGGAVGAVGMFGSIPVLANLSGDPYHLLRAITHHAGGADPISFLWMFSAAFVPIALSIPFSLGLKNRVRRPNRELADRLKSRIHFWASRRYGVNLDETCLDDSLLLFVGSKQAPGAFHWLTADSQTFKLVAGQRGFHLEQHREAEGEHAPAGSVAAIEHIEGTDISTFTGEASTLAQQIRQQLDLLGTRSLSSEGQYTLGRVGQDFKQAISLNAELLSFGELGVEESALMAETLGTLSAELGALLSQERADAVQQLRVQRDYVRDRQQPKPSGRLALPSANQLQAGAEALLRSVENSTKTTTEAPAISAGLER